MEVNRPASQTSLDSFADSTLTGSTVSKPKAPPKFQNTPQAAAPLGSESSGFGASAFG